MDNPFNAFKWTKQKWLAKLFGCQLCKESFPAPYALQCQFPWKHTPAWQLKASMFLCWKVNMRVCLQFTVYIIRKCVLFGIWLLGAQWQLSTKIKLHEVYGEKDLHQFNFKKLHVGLRAVYCALYPGRPRTSFLGFWRKWFMDREFWRTIVSRSLLHHVTSSWKRSSKRSTLYIGRKRIYMHCNSKLLGVLQPPPHLIFPRAYFTCVYNEQRVKFFKQKTLLFS